MAAIGGVVAVALLATAIYCLVAQNRRRASFSLVPGLIESEELATSDSTSRGMMMSDPYSDQSPSESSRAGGGGAEAYALGPLASGGTETAPKKVPKRKQRSRRPVDIVDAELQAADAATEHMIDSMPTTELGTRCKADWLTRSNVPFRLPLVHSVPPSGVLLLVCL